MTDPQDQVKILIVDDSAEKRLSLGSLLEDLGRVVSVTSGREALRRLLAEEFAVILMDVNMPGMDGFETAALIRQRRSTEQIPIIFITAYGDEIFVTRGYSLGAVDYIQTPVVPDILRTKVSVFVDLHRKSEQVRRQSERLRQRTAELSELATLLTQAEQRERRRLARVLHDHIQQLLVAANMRLSLASQLRGTQQAEALRQVEHLITQSIEASRSLTTQLSPPILYDAGLVPALEWLARRMKEDHGLTVRIQAGHAPVVQLDDVRAFVFEVVRELLFNIVKHAGVLTAELTVTESDSGNVCLVVHDAGRGFDPSSLSSGSERFGLFSIRERLNLLNGRLEIVSAPGAGTTVTLDVLNPPSHRIEPPSPKDPAADIRVKKRTVHKSEPPMIRIILADDHELLRKGIAGLLSGQPDMEIIAEASNGLEVVTLAQEADADVVVMDVSMPGMDGIEATREIVRLAPHLRVIGLSMHDQEHMARAMQEAGAAAYLTKDGPPESLIAAIRATRDGLPSSQQVEARA